MSVDHTNLNTFKNDTPLSKLYFENLNGLRAVAALMVIIHHAEEIKDMFHIANIYDQKVIVSIGKLGVILFFVLSGFLISYLLFNEQEQTKTINVKNFYIRRILRIWPLYFLIIFLALFVIPFISIFTISGFERSVVWDHLGLKITCFVLLAPNYVLNSVGIIPYAAHTWSIGAEEQFYLIWPALNKWIKNKWLLLIGVIFIYLFIKFKMPVLVPTNRFTQNFFPFWQSTSIDCMAIGGLFALIAKEKSRFTTFIKQILFNKYFQWFIFISTAILIFNGFYLNYFPYEFYSVLFGILILNLAINKERIFSLEYGWLNYLGKISFGLYIYHPIAIVLSIRILQQLNCLYNIVLYPLIFTIVISISSISYTYFEKIFINKKVNYSN